MPMTGFPATTSAYGRALSELLGDELHERLRVRISVEVGDPARAVTDIGEESSRLVAIGPGNDDDRAFGNQPAGEAQAFRYGYHGDGAAQLGRGHSCSSGDAANACSTSARDSTASAIATNAAAHNSVSTSSPSPHDPPGACVSDSTSAMRSAVARKASSPVTSYSNAPPHPTRAFAGSHTPSPMATTRSWSSTAASRSSTSPPSSN